MSRRPTSQAVRGSDRVDDPTYVMAAAELIYCKKCDFQTADQDLMDSHDEQFHPEVPRNVDPNVTCNICNQPRGAGGWIECFECKNWYHWGCANVRRAPFPNVNWYCPQGCRANYNLVRENNTRKKKKLATRIAKQRPYFRDPGYAVMDYGKKMVSWIEPSAQVDGPAAAAGNAQQLQQQMQQQQQPTPMQFQHQQLAQQAQQRKQQIQRRQQAANQQQQLLNLQRMTHAAAALAAQNMPPQPAANVAAVPPQPAGNVAAVPQQPAANVAAGNRFDPQIPTVYVPPFIHQGRAVEQQLLTQQCQSEEHQLTQQLQADLLQLIQQQQAAIQMLRTRQAQRQISFQSYHDARPGASNQ